MNKIEVLKGKIEEKAEDLFLLQDLQSINGGAAFCIRLIDSDIPGQDSCGVKIGGGGICITFENCSGYYRP